ncbi:MAG: 2-hydroxyglutaryl-CoA dehydratase, partial [Bacteroidales bacterium]|nr:2-hydroxyglutaryl-CoA dehydratase [Bacteroidales bacterium]
MTKYRVGLDIGSTTAKIVVLNDKEEIVFSKYTRHNANVIGTIKLFFHTMRDQLGECEISLTITGSVGMGLADYLNASFVQEVIAATEYSKKIHPEITTMIDIGGEDAKVVFFREGGMADLRMNGNCAGGTGAFIDQMAIILGVDIEEMDALASKAKTIYPIASRCGVFSKTDIQTLLANHISKADAAASIFHAVAVQTISTLAKGNDITPKILFCGGPLNFISSLRKAFYNYLKIDESEFVVPENANLIPAYGAALYSDKSTINDINTIVERLDIGQIPLTNNSLSLPQIFSSKEEYEQWKKEKKENDITIIDPKEYDGPVYIGIDSGSTTTKIVLIDKDDRVLFSFYCQNNGNPIEAVGKGLQEMYATFTNVGKIPDIQGS